MKLVYAFLLLYLTKGSADNNGTSNCGGTLLATSSLKYLQSPGYPSGYSSNLTCIWVIRALPPNMIRIIVIDSVLEKELVCKRDSVNVYDGPSVHSPHMNTWCGTMTPTLQSRRSNVTIKFKTNSNNNFRGFKLQYFSTQDEYHCRYYLTSGDIPKTLTSPGYPNMYQNDARCFWLITAPEGKIISLRVLDSQIEESLLCRHDWVRVLDGPSSQSSKLGAFCGFRKRNYTSSGNRVLIEFHSDAHLTYRGFKIDFTSGHFYNTNPITTNTCGGELQANATPNYIESPGYPNPYNSNLTCTWVIRAVPPAFIRIYVLESQIQYEMECKQDNVTVYDGDSSDNDRINVWCGSMTPTLQTRGSAMTIVFNSNSQNSFRGFKLEYVLTSELYRCGTNYSATNNPFVFTSPGYPSMYPNDAHCYWILSAAPGQQVQVRVTDSNIEESFFCKYDWVRVLDGNRLTSPQIGRFCGFKTPSYSSSGNVLLVEFHSDHYRSFRGFILEFASGIFTACTKQTLIARTSSNYITSPGYPQSYRKQTACSWLFDTQDSDAYVNINVLTSVMNTNDCNSSFLQAFDGSGSSSPSLSKWCGSGTPNLKSSGRYMLLVYSTQQSWPSTSFRIQYTSVQIGDNKGLYGAISGGVVAAVFVVAVVIIVAIYCSARTRTPARETTSSFMKMQ